MTSEQRIKALAIAYGLIDRATADIDVSPHLMDILFSAINGLAYDIDPEGAYADPTEGDSPATEPEMLAAAPDPKAN